MSRQCISERQKEVFRHLAEFEILILAVGVQGISANMSGRFILQSYRDEDRLEVGDGTFHVHIDWTRMKRVEIGVIEIEGRREGMVSFFDEDERLLRFYRQDGAFPEDIQKFQGSLI